MAYAAGDRQTASRTNNLQSRVFYAIGSGTILASQTDADVTDATVTFTTLTDNATYYAFGVWDFNATGGVPGASSTGRLVIDGATQSPLATFRGDAANDRGTCPQNYSGTLTSAGSHTLKLQGTTATNTNILGTNCSILVIVEEVV